MKYATKLKTNFKMQTFAVALQKPVLVGFYYDMKCVSIDANIA